ncbi:BTB domain-containing protein [Trichonephila clavata]|uniref:BTB domain-containing protein n=1 Tax=Trichonephila clavata TaxID=2740835 RepID=A0A8X6FVA6_TRICU|nr:BTB domain-containing protein [Trichonephila clavata]
MADGSETFLQVEDTKYVKIENFSQVNHCQKARDYFVLRRNPFLQLFCITVYPNGMSPETQGYISIHLYKCFRDPDGYGYLKMFSGANKDSFSWTLSVVDVNGTGKLYQSYAKENSAYFPYNIILPNFLERSVILKQVDELLPGDVLTMKCELYGILCSSPFLEKKHFQKNVDFQRSKTSN